MRAQRSARDETPNEDTSGTESRIVRLESGLRWRATVVARLISEDIAAGRESARLVIRLECLTTRRRALRVAVPGARTLAGVSESVLRELIERPEARRSSGATRIGKGRR